MKSLAWKLIGIALVLAVILVSGLSLHNHYAGKNVDPVLETQKLIDRNGRDGALEMVRFFSDANAGSEQLDELSGRLDYTFLGKVSAFALDGVIKGKVHDSYSGAGAISADLLIVGDIRDLGIQSWKYLTKADDFDKWILILSAGGIGLTGTSFVNGCESLAKNTFKYAKRIPKSENRGVLKTFMKGELPRRYHEPVWRLFKANDRSVPRTASVLSRINDPRQIDCAVDMVSRNRRAGNVYIELAGENGLFLYASTPRKMRKHFIEVFRKNPRAVLGLTNSHLALHAIKIAKKYHLSAPMVVVAGISLLLGLLPIAVVWGIFIVSSGYAVISFPRMFRRRRPAQKRGAPWPPS